MGAFDATDQSDYALKIFALGSCVGAAIFSIDLSVVAMAHIVLPSSKTDPIKSHSLPGYFADTAIPKLIEAVRRKHKNPNIKFFAKIAGGAKTNADLGDYFSVGQRNAIAVKEELKKHNIPVVAEDTGRQLFTYGFGLCRQSQNDFVFCLIEELGKYNKMKNEKL